MVRTKRSDGNWAIVHFFGAPQRSEPKKTCIRDCRPLWIPAASAGYAVLRPLMRPRVLRFKIFAFPRGKATRKQCILGMVVRYSNGLFLNLTCGVGVPTWAMLSVHSETESRRVLPKMFQKFLGVKGAFFQKAPLWVQGKALPAGGIFITSAHPRAPRP